MHFGGFAANKPEWLLASRCSDTRRGGDRDTFLFREAIRITRNHADAEDLLQDQGLRRFLHSNNAPTTAYAHIGFLPTTTPTATERASAAAAISGRGHYRPAARRRAEHSSTGLRSQEEHALESLPDNNLEGATRAVPEQFLVAVCYADVEDRRCHRRSPKSYAPQLDR
jgi:RNA polymerase sigma-70 factor, ECF subfamily